MSQGLSLQGRSLISVFTLGAAWGAFWAVFSATPGLASLFGNPTLTAAQLLQTCLQMNDTHGARYMDCGLSDSEATIITKLPAAVIGEDAVFHGPTTPLTSASSGNAFVTWDLSKSNQAFLLSPKVTVGLRHLVLKGVSVNVTSINNNLLQPLAFVFSPEAQLRLDNITLEFLTCAMLGQYQAFFCSSLLPTHNIQVCRCRVLRSPGMKQNANIF